MTFDLEQSSKVKWTFSQLPCKLQEIEIHLYCSHIGDHVHVHSIGAMTFDLKPRSKGQMWASVQKQGTGL